MDYDSLRRILFDFYVKVLIFLRPHLSLDEVAGNATTIAVEYAKDHPYHTTFTAVGVGLVSILGAGWLTAPLLKLIGFGPQGPTAGKRKLFC